MVEFGRNHENHLFRPIHNVPLNCSLHTTKQYSIIWCENTLKVTPNYRRCILFWSIYEWSEQKNMLRVCVFVVCCFFFSLLIPLYSFTIDDDNDDDCVSLVFRTEPYVLCAKAIVLCIRCLSTTFIYRIEHGNECAPPNCHEVGCGHRTKWNDLSESQYDGGNIFNLYQSRRKL